VNKAQAYYPDCPEPLLVNLARGGDRAAFEEIVRRRQGALRGLLRRLTGEAALADDLAQQAFLKAWISLRTLRKARAFPAWLKRLTVNLWLQHARRNDALEGAETLDAVRPSSSMAPAGMGQDLDRALAGLAPGERICVVLAYHEGMSHREVAEVTGLPLGTVKSHVRRGSEKLRESLAAYDPAPEGTT
jgi:RNA polymerase sigma-70 factor (ECF subfamily)